MQEPLTRGHKKRARTLEDLLAAATRVFSRKEAILATFLEIAEEARVASGTVHNYFKSKDELIEATAAKLIERINGPVWKDFARVADPAERLAIAIKSAVHLIEDDPDWGAAVLRLVDATHRTTEKLTNLLPDILEEGRKSGRLRFRNREAALNLVGGTILAGMRSVSGGAKAEPMGEDLVEHVMLALGLSAEEARQLAKSAGAAPSPSDPSHPGPGRRSLLGEAAPAEPARRGRRKAS